MAEHHEHRAIRNVWDLQGRTVNESHTVLRGDPNQLPAVGMTRAEWQDITVTAATAAARDAIEAELEREVGVQFADSADDDAEDGDAG